MAGVLTHIDATAWGPPDFRGRMCFLARINSRGDIEDAAYLKSLNYSAAADNENGCLALDIVPRVNNIIAVGYNTIWSSNVKLARVIMVYATASLKPIKERQWMNEAIYGKGQQIATDVHAADADGTIYITGYMNQVHTRRKNDDHECFVLKLDGDLNIQYSKNFGYKPETVYNSLSQN